MTTPAYSMGRAYGLLASTLPKIIGTPAKVAAASLHPLAGLANGMTLIIANNAMTNALNDEMGETLDDVPSDFPATLGLDEQGQWWAGYYSVKSNSVADAIKASDMTQTQIAEALGVPPSTVSRWANGTVTPRESRREKILEITEANKMTKLTPEQLEASKKGTEENLRLRQAWIDARNGISPLFRAPREVLNNKVKEGTVIKDVIVRRENGISMIGYRDLQNRWISIVDDVIRD